MATGDTIEGDLPAVDFGRWLTEIEGALRGEHGTDVPCGSCTACCTSSQFIHIGPEETDALAHIPTEMLFPAPRLPRGHVLLGYDERGHCPMLVEGACSIYEHRPRTCRTYDCRIFPATGVEVAPSQPAIGAQARRWVFEHPTSADDEQHRAVVAAAQFLREHGRELPVDIAPVTATQAAVLAIEVHESFMVPARPTATVLGEVIARRTAASPSR
jgi:Fe-S-cluster containining protein